MNGTLEQGLLKRKYGRGNYKATAMEAIYGLTIIISLIAFAVWLRCNEWAAEEWEDKAQQDKLLGDAKRILQKPINKK